MAIKVSGTTVIDDSRQLTNIASVDATTVAALGAAGVGAGGGTITATADGAISAGDAVSLQTNGTVKKTQEAVTDLGTPALINNYTVGGLGGPGYLNQPAMGYFSSNGYIYYTYMYSSNYYINRGTYNSVNGEIQSVVTSDSQSAGNWDAALSAAYNPTNNTFAVITAHSGVLYLYMYYSRPDGSLSSAVVTVSSSPYSFYTGDQSACVVCNQDTGNFHVYWIDGGFSTIRGSIYSPTIGAAPSYSVSITTVRASDLVYNPSNTNRHISVAKDESTTDSFLIVHKRASDSSMQADYFTHTSSGVSNVGSMLYQTGTTTSTQYTAIAYNVEDAKFVVATNFNNTARVYTLQKPSTTGGAPTASSAVTYSSQNTQGSTRLIYDPKVKDVIIKWWDGGSSEIRAARVDSSGSTPSVGTHVNVYSTGGSGYLLSDITYLNDHNLFFALERDNGSQGHRTVSIQTSTTSTNNTNWIGFASEAIADTASGDILVVGSTDENQSGLTTGSTYYVQVDGTLGTSTTDAIKAGRALSATKLLITEGNA